MKRVIDIALAKRSFAFDEEAGDRLTHYLNAFRDALKGESQVSEIMEDIEERIAEILEGRLDRLRQVVTVELVCEVISQLGMPDGSSYDFSDRGESQDRESAYSEPEPPYEQQRLYRNPRAGKLGGVCAGIADYFNWDVTAVRVLFLLALFLWSFGIWVYLVLWIAVPEQNSEGKTFSEHLKRRLFRDPDKKKIAGVCSGLAHYLSIDLSIVRILFVILFFCGAGIVLYVILWLAVPFACTPAEKCEMHNVPPTAENLRKYANY